MSEACKCGAAQTGSACGCGILERRVVGEPLSLPTFDGEFDWRGIATQLAAIDERACRIIEAADKLALAAEMVIKVQKYGGRLGIDELQKALDAFEVVRNGS